MLAKRFAKGIGYDPWIVIRERGLEFYIRWDNIGYIQSVKDQVFILTKRNCKFEYPKGRENLLAEILEKRKQARFAKNLKENHEPQAGIHLAGL